MFKYSIVNNILITLVTLAIFTGCSAIIGENKNSPGESKGAINDLVIIDNKKGGGNTAIANKNVTVHYTGWLYNESAADKKGSQFDSSMERGIPFTFTLGKRQVIVGWDKGVVGMKEGGKRTLIIPSDMAYGQRGSGRGIPPNSVLLFDIELLEVN